MDENQSLPRSPELMSAADTALLVIDVQEKAVAAVADGQRVVFNVRRLVDAAGILGLPVVATELDRKAMGAVMPELADRLPVVASRTTLSCGGCGEVFRELQRRGVQKLLVCGLEAHVAVQQTVLDLLAHGWRVYVAADAVASRLETDCRIALGRMDSAGATLTTAEAAMYEWCQAAGTPEFEQLTRLASQQGP
jgi:nicotinamidase-related amidase